MTTYVIEYHVNLIHEVEIDAETPEEATAKFEEMYWERHDELPDYHDISHDVVHVAAHGLR